MVKGLFKKIIASFLAMVFLGQTLCHSAYGQLGVINPPPLSFNPSLLRYLSVNQANPFNYFNFLLDRGDSFLSKDSLNAEAKKLIHYFFLGITLPDDAFWVNLRPDEPGRITSDELSKTDMGRVLLQQDLQLKRDVARYLHPHHPKGGEFWKALYQEVGNLAGKEKLNKTAITTSNRVWIVPKKAIVIETEDGVLVAEARLKLLLENEYLKLNPQDQTQLISERLMKQYILPYLEEEINTSGVYSPLRQIYHSLILAQWFKRRHGQDSGIYSRLIDKGYTGGLESKLPWSKSALWQEYLSSYQAGEYKVKENLAGLNRMYVSGGMDFTSSPIEIVGRNTLGSDSPLLLSAQQNFSNFVPVVTTGNAVEEKGKFPVSDTEAVDVPLKQGATEFAGSPLKSESARAERGAEATNQSVSSSMERVDNKVRLMEGGLLFPAQDVNSMLEQELTHAKKNAFIELVEERIDIGLKLAKNIPLIDGIFKGSFEESQKNSSKWKETLIDIIFNHILQNSDRAGASRFVVKTSLATDGEHIWIDIEDNGSGINKDLLDDADPNSIFKEGRSFRDEPHIPQHGFAMYWVKQDIERMGGGIEVIRNVYHRDIKAKGEQSGVTIRITLPISPSAFSAPPGAGSPTEIEVLVAQADNLLQTGTSAENTIEAISLLEGLSLLFTLKQALEKERLWFSERGALEELIELVQQIDALKSLQMDVFLEKYFGSSTARLGDYRVRVADLPFDYQILNEDMRSRVSQLLTKAHQQAGVSEFLDRVKIGFDKYDSWGAKNLVQYLSAISKDAVPGLINMLEETSEPELFHRLIWLLGQSRDRRAVPALLKIIAPLQSQEVSIFKTDDGREGILLDRVNILSSNWLAIRNVAVALGEIGDPQAVGPLIGLLDYPIRFVVEEAIQSLVKLKVYAAVKPLIDIVMNKGLHFTLRQRAIWALGELGEKSGNGNIVGALEFLLSDQEDLSYNLMLITPAVRALWKIGSSESREALKRVFAKENGDTLARWIESTMGVSFPLSTSDPDTGAEILKFAGKLSVLPQEVFRDGTPVEFPKWVYEDSSLSDMLVNREDSAVRAIRQPDGKFLVIRSGDKNTAAQTLQPLVQKYLASRLNGERTSAFSVANEFGMSQEWIPALEEVLGRFAQGFVGGVFLSLNPDQTYFINKEADAAGPSAARGAESPTEKEGQSASSPGVGKIDVKEPGDIVAQKDLAEVYWGYISKYAEGLIEKSKVTADLVRQGRMTIQERSSALNEILKAAVDDFAGVLSSLGGSKKDTKQRIEKMRQKLTERIEQGSKQQAYANAMTAWNGEEMVNNGQGDFENVTFPRDMALLYSGEKSLSIITDQERNPGLYYISGRNATFGDYYSWMKSAISAAASQSKTFKDFLPKLEEMIKKEMANNKGFKQKIEQIQDELKELGIDKMKKVRFVDSGFQTFPLMFAALVHMMNPKIEVCGLVQQSGLKYEVLPQLNIENWRQQVREAIKKSSAAGYAVPDLSATESAGDFLKHPFNDPASNEKVLKASPPQTQLEAYWNQLCFVLGAINYHDLLTSLVGELTGQGAPKEVAEALAHEAIQEALDIVDAEEETTKTKVSAMPALVQAARPVPVEADTKKQEPKAEKPQPAKDSKAEESQLKEPEAQKPQLTIEEVNKNIASLLPGYFADYKIEQIILPSIDLPKETSWLDFKKSPQYTKFVEDLTDAVAKKSKISRAEAKKLVDSITDINWAEVSLVKPAKQPQESLAGIEKSLQKRLKDTIPDFKLSDNTKSKLTNLIESKQESIDLPVVQEHNAKEVQGAIDKQQGEKPSRLKSWFGDRKTQIKLTIAAIVTIIILLWPSSLGKDDTKIPAPVPGPKIEQVESQKPNISNDEAYYKYSYNQQGNRVPVEHPELYSTTDGDLLKVYRQLKPQVSKEFLGGLIGLKNAEGRTLHQGDVDYFYRHFKSIETSVSKGKPFNKHQRRAIEAAIGADQLQKGEKATFDFQRKDLETSKASAQEDNRDIAEEDTAVAEKVAEDKAASTEESSKDKNDSSAAGAFAGMIGIIGAGTRRMREFLKKGEKKLAVLFSSVEDYTSRMRPAPEQDGIYGGSAGTKHKKYIDENGRIWLFKVYPKERSHRTLVDEFVYGVAKKLGFTDALEVFAGRVDGEFGLFIEWADNSGLLWDEIDKYAKDFPQHLPKSVLIRMIKEQVLDWLVSQHDSHSGSFLKSKDGKRLYPIDKSQAFKYIGDADERLSTDYNPNGKYNGYNNLRYIPVYNIILEAIAQGKTALSLEEAWDAIQPILLTIENMDTDAYLDELFPYAIFRFDVIKNPEETIKNSGEFLSLARQRKANIVSDFEEFYAGLGLKQKRTPHTLEADKGGLLTEKGKIKKSSSPLPTKNRGEALSALAPKKEIFADDASSGGIDFSRIELTLKDQAYISNLNPADLKVLRAAMAFKNGWDSLSLLYVHEIMLLLKDNLIKDIQNRELLYGILQQLRIKEFLDPQALEFFSLLQYQKPISEVKIALSQKI